MSKYICVCIEPMMQLAKQTSIQFDLKSTKSQQQP